MNRVFLNKPRVIHHVGGQNTDNPVKATDIIDDYQLILDQSWYDKVQLNMREAGPGKVGVHVWKSGQSCRYLVFSLTELAESDFFAKLHERAKIAWQTPDPHARPCPNCGQDQRQHRRRYEGRAFCGFCGVELEAIDYDAR